MVIRGNGKGKKGRTHTPKTVFTNAWLEEELGERREDMIDKERGRRSIAATAMKAGWNANNESPSGGFERRRSVGWAVMGDGGCFWR